MTIAIETPPTDLREWDFSFGRKTGLFRFRSEGEQYPCSRAAGQVEVLEADSDRGHLTFKCKLVLQNGTAYTYLGDEPVPIDSIPESSCPVFTGKVVDTTGKNYAEMPLGIHTWRCCYFREQRNWRLRHEGSCFCGGPDRLWFVENYKGVINLNWFSGSVNLGDQFDAHIFHRGEVVVDDEGTAYFRNASPQ
jgi:hypothetical protein